MQGLGCDIWERRRRATQVCKESCSEYGNRRHEISESESASGSQSAAVGNPFRPCPPTSIDSDRDCDPDSDPDAWQRILVRNRAHATCTNDCCRTLTYFLPCFDPAVTTAFRRMVILTSETKTWMREENMMTRIRSIAFVFMICLLGFSGLLLSQSASALFEQGLLKENGEGDLNGAMAIFRQIVQDQAADPQFAPRLSSTSGCATRSLDCARPGPPTRKS